MNVIIRAIQPPPIQIPVIPSTPKYECHMTPTKVVIETDVINEIIEVLDGGAF